MSSRLTLRQNIYLIGDIDYQIQGNKLPSNLQVFKLLFFNTRVLQHNLKTSVALVIKETETYWGKAGIPTKRSDHSQEKLLKLYKNWRTLQKHSGKAWNLEKEKCFSENLNNLFDIASADLSSLDDAHQEFLDNQRKPGILGYIGNISNGNKIFRKNLENAQIMLNRKRKSETMCE